MRIAARRDWRPVPAPGLPEGLILFDGVCVLCSGWVAHVIRRDPGGLYRFLPIQSEAGRGLALRFGVDPENPETNIVIRDGHAWFKGDAALRVLADLEGWRWTRVFRRILPHWLRNRAYDIVAQNRYRLFGRRETCLAPTPELRARFPTTIDAP